MAKTDKKVFLALHLLLLGGIILIVLGLIGEYVGRIFMCVNSSPQYVERQVIKKQ